MMPGPPWENVAGNAVAGAHVLDDPAVQVLLPDPDLTVRLRGVTYRHHLRPQQIDAAAKQRLPTSIAGRFEHVQRGHQRAGRTPQRFAGLVLEVALDQREQLIGDHRGARVPPLQQQYRRVAEKVRRPLGFVRGDPVAAVLVQARNDWRQVEIDPRRALLAQALQRPDHTGRAVVEHRLRHRLVAVFALARVHRPERGRVEPCAEVVGDRLDRAARRSLVPRRGGQGLVARRVVQHRAFRAPARRSWLAALRASRPRRARPASGRPASRRAPRGR